MELTDEDRRIAEAILEAFKASDEGTGYTDLYTGGGHEDANFTLDGHYIVTVLIERLGGIFREQSGDA